MYRCFEKIRTKMLVLQFFFCLYYIYDKVHDRLEAPQVTRKLLALKLYGATSPKVTHRVAVTLSSRVHDVTSRDPPRRGIAAALARSVAAVVPRDQSMV